MSSFQMQNDDLGTKKGTPGIEPEVARSAVECSAIEPYPRTLSPTFPHLIDSKTVARVRVLLVLCVFILSLTPLSLFYLHIFTTIKNNAYDIETLDDNNEAS
jgi:hypothetical protein